MCSYLWIHTSLGQYVSRNSCSCAGVRMPMTGLMLNTLSVSRWCWILEGFGASPGNKHWRLGFMICQWYGRSKCLQRGKIMIYKQTIKYLLYILSLSRCVKGAHVLFFMTTFFCKVECGLVGLNLTKWSAVISHNSPNSGWFSPPDTETSSTVTSWPVPDKIYWDMYTCVFLEVLCYIYIYIK